MQTECACDLFALSERYKAGRSRAVQQCGKDEVETEEKILTYGLFCLGVGSYVVYDSWTGDYSPRHMAHKAYPRRGKSLPTKCRNEEIAVLDAIGGEHS